MGKASRQLSEARHELNKEMEENNTEKIINENNIETTNTSFNNEFAHTVRQEMLEYCDNNSYALCEYLDLENLSNFIFWLRSR
tara:strand:+ start:1305 stop:1553 length:249 start_codon:yes stop_codon:yes gene_type:complete